MAHMELEQSPRPRPGLPAVIEVRGDEADAADFANLAKVLTKQKKYKEARAEYIKAKARDAKNWRCW